MSVIEQLYDSKTVQLIRTLHSDDVECRDSLFKAFGQKIIEGTLNQCYPNCEITTESLPAGVYLLVIRYNEQRLSTHNISINQN